MAHRDILAAIVLTKVQTKGLCGKYWGIASVRTKASAAEINMNIGMAGILDAMTARKVATAWNNLRTGRDKGNLSILHQQKYTKHNSSCGFHMKLHAM